MAESPSTPAAVATVAPPGPIAGLVILVIVLALIAAWIVLGLQFMHDTSLIGGFMMLWYWANNEQLEIKRLPAAIIGALVGIFLGWFIIFAMRNGAGPVSPPGPG